MKIPTLNSFAYPPYLARSGKWMNVKITGKGVGTRKHDMDYRNFAWEWYEKLRVTE